MDPTTLSARGRLAAPNDRDDWSMVVTPIMAATQLDIDLTWDGARPYQLCLMRLDGPPVQCRDGTTGVTLGDLLLPAGTYVLEVTGRNSLTEGYRLQVTGIGAPAADREREPDDLGGSATVWDPTQVMHGRLTGADDDLYRVTIAGDPQLWTVEAKGSGIESVSWVQPDTTQLGRATSTDGTSATLADLYLLPGDHTVRVRGHDGSYSLTLTPQGGPDPNAELEPNDDLSRAESIAVDGHKTGRLANAADIDIFRFSLAATDHLTLRVEPGTGGTIGMELWSGDTRLARLLDPVAEVPVVYDALLYPGDYAIWLRPVVTSDADYRLTLERGDPFTAEPDLEPNDTPADARPVPADLVITGTGWGTRGEDDWYALGPLPSATTLSLATDGAITHVALSDGVSDLRLTPGADAGTWSSAPLAAGQPTWIRVTATGPYRIAVSGDGLIPGPSVGALAASLVLTPDVREVAGFWLDAQRVTGHLAITDHGASGQRLRLDATASAPGWRVDIATPEVTVAEGGTVEVPVVVDVPPDVSTDIPVRLTIRARDAAGDQSTASADITPRAGTPAVDPRPVWPVPDALLGGLDVASLALGAAPVAAADFVGEGLLHDGRALTGSGFSAIFRNQPITLTMDLAGDQPVPVAGFSLDPLAGDGSLARQVRSIELQLSADGTTYETVYAGDLAPDKVDQPIVLDAPVPATFARLVIHSSYGGTTGGVSLGEWKVVATPGSDPASTPRNIADPIRGGHVAWMSPQPDSIQSVQGMLTEDPAIWAPIVDLRRQLQWVVGFWQDRAAQVTEIEWVNPPASNPAIRSTSVAVEVSVEGPLGPWVPLGDWALERAGDGSVPPLILSRPTWARFIRFTMAGPQQSSSRWELPSTIRVLEAPTDATYRSILAEWGLNSPDGIHEVLVPPAATNPTGPDAGDTPADAQPLAAGQTVEGQVARHQDVDWYSVDVPPGQSVLTFRVAHSPGGGVGLTLQDASGQAVRLFGVRTEDPGITQWGARVQPGTYRVQVEQPVLSTVFAYDTSGSMAAYVPNVREALRAFVRGITPGDEAVKLIPFGGQSLAGDWADDPFILEQVVSTQVAVGASSDAEGTMAPAVKSLLARHGTRAMLVLTDAETTSYDKDTALWEQLAAARPVIFAVHVGGSADPALTTQLMQDWANSSGGHYQYAAVQSDIDQAFARMTTWLRRPARYAMSWEATDTELPLAGIRVATPLGPTGVPVPPPLGKDVGVELVLDTSGSMTKRLGTSTRIGVAKDVLTRLVNGTLPEGIPVALRTFKAKRGSCDSTLVTKLTPLDRAAMARVIGRLKIKGAKTPIGATLHVVADDLGLRPGPKVVVLVTDGKETCKGRSGRGGAATAGPGPGGDHQHRGSCARRCRAEGGDGAMGGARRRHVLRRAGPGQPCGRHHRRPSRTLPRVRHDGHGGCHRRHRRPRGPGPDGCLSHRSALGPRARVRGRRPGPRRDDRPHAGGCGPLTHRGGSVPGWRQRWPGRAAIGSRGMRAPSGGGRWRPHRSGARSPGALRYRASPRYDTPRANDG